MSSSKSSVEMAESGIGDRGSDDAVAPISAAEEAAVIRKLDFRLLPLIFVLYSLSVLDRSNLGNAKLAGMESDINLRGNNYEWLGTAFYISCKYSRVMAQNTQSLMLLQQISSFNGPLSDGSTLSHTSG